MPRPSTSFLIPAAIALAVAVGCAGTGASRTPSPAPSVPPPTTSPTTSPTAPATIGYPTGAKDLVLRLRYVGGFVAPSAHVLSLPQISVYGDGTVLGQGPQIAIYPGPTLPSIQAARLTPVGMQRLLAAARDAGLLGADAHYDRDGIMDAATAEFLVDAAGRIHTISAYALAEGNGPGPREAPAATAAREKLAAFQARLADLDHWLGSDLAAWKPYTASAMALVVSPGAPPNDPKLDQAAIKWPLAIPLATFGKTWPGNLGDGTRCGAVSGADLETLMPLLEKANALTPWTSGSASFGMRVRPLLPNESGCASLT